MKKIKKTMALVAALLLMSSNVNALVRIDCAQLAIDVYNDLIDNHPELSVGQCNAIAIGVWDRCDEQNKK